MNKEQDSPIHHLFYSLLFFNISYTAAQIEDTVSVLELDNSYVVFLFCMMCFWLILNSRLNPNTALS